MIMPITTTTTDRRSPRRILADDLRQYGAHPERKLPTAGSDWERAEWDRLAEYATGWH